MEKEWAATDSKWKSFPIVEEWKRQYLPASRGGPSIPLRRFKFLVLHGPSRFGKSAFAKSLFPQCLVLQSQTCQEPYLRPFKRALHASVLFDELDWRVIVSNKLLFQAQNAPVQLAQSKCQQHTYTVRNYAVPLIVCTNKWLHGQTEADAEDVQWQKANCFELPVCGNMWEE